MYDKKIYCPNCKQETLHQISKAFKSKDSGNEEEGIRDYSYYDYSQCLACGRMNSYGCFLNPSHYLEVPNPNKETTPGETM